MKKNFFIAAGLSLALVAAGIGSLSVRNEAREAHAVDVPIVDGYYVISTIDQFSTIFDRGATHASHNIKLAADLDVSSRCGTVKAGQSGMAGEFTGIFDGQGHRLYGIGSTGSWDANVGALFHIIKGTVKNLTIDWVAPRDNVGSIAYQNYGTFENVTVITHVDGTPNSFGAFVAQSADGDSYINCNSHFIVSGTRGGSVGTVSFGGSPTTVTNCHYSDTILQGAAGAAALTIQDFTIADLSAVASNKELPVGDTFAAGGNYGIPFEWESNDENVVTVSGNTVTAVGAGNTTVVGTPISQYSAAYSSFSVTYNVTVTSGAVDVSSVDINNPAKTKIDAGENLNLSAELTGQNYESIAWSSSSNSIATVSGNGLNAVVTGVAQGNVTITVTVTVTSNPLVQKTDSVDLTVLAVVYNNLQFANSTEFTWNGAGLDKIYVTGLDNYTQSNYSFTAPITGTSFNKGSVSGWSLDGASHRLYFHYNGAPAANSGEYLILLNLIYVGETTKTIYVAELNFNGVTYQEPSVSISGDASITLGDSGDYSVVTTNTCSIAGYLWSFSDASASIDDVTASSISLTGLVIGKNKVLTVVLTSVNHYKYTANKNIEIANEQVNVSDVTLTLSDSSIKEDKFTTVSVELTGQLYESFEWSAYPAASVSITESTIEGAKITGLVAHEDVAITLSVYVSGQAEPITDTVYLDVLSAKRIDIYYLIPSIFTGLGSNGYGVAVYGQVNVNSPLSDTGYDVEYSGAEYDLYKASNINIDELDGDNLYCFLASASNYGDRWGKGGFHLGAAGNRDNGVVLVCDYSGRTAADQTKVGYASDMNLAIDFYNDNIKTVRDANSGSVCSANFTNVVAAYNALSANVKSLANSICDNTAQYDDVTVLDTINMMNESLSSGSSNFVISSTNNNDSAIIILIISLIGLAALTGVAIYLKKRKAE